MKIRIAVVEDDATLRESLVLLLEDADDVRCIGAYRTGEEAVKDIPLKCADVALLDIKLPGMSGIECARQLNASSPDTEVVMLTVFEDSEKIFSALKAGASGYLLKRTPSDEILKAIREVYSGGSPMSAEIARRVVNSFKQNAKPSPGLPDLTAREEEILELLATGKRYKEIADTLFISSSTVHAHLHHIYEKLHVRSRSEAVVKFLQR